MHDLLGMEVGPWQVVSWYYHIGCACNRSTAHDLIGPLHSLLTESQRRGSLQLPFIGSRLNAPCRDQNRHDQHQPADNTSQSRERLSIRLIHGHGGGWVRILTSISQMMDADQMMFGLFLFNGVWSI